MKSRALIFLLSFPFFLLNAQQEKTLLNYQMDLMKLVNQQRILGCHCGSIYYPPVSPLNWSSKLESASQIQAKYLATKLVLTHRGDDGKDVRARLAKVNYSWKTYSENIANGFEEVEEVFAAWMASSGHCKNIMGDYKEMGVFRIDGFWIQDFASPKTIENTE
ncbi:MAG: CAP domain-containing protein [Saprospiraceae bacterium]